MGTQTNTLIVSSHSSRNKNKNGKKISVNINEKIHNREYLMVKKGKSGRIHAGKVQASKKLFLKLIRNKRKYRPSNRCLRQSF